MTSNWSNATHQAGEWRRAPIAAMQTPIREDRCTAMSAPWPVAPYRCSRRRGHTGRHLNAATFEGQRRIVAVWAGDFSEGDLTP